MYEQQIAAMQKQMELMQQMLSEIQKGNEGTENSSNRGACSSEKINLQEDMPLNTTRSNEIVNENLDFTASLNKIIEEQQENELSKEEAEIKKINLRAMQIAADVKQSIIDKVAKSEFSYLGFIEPGIGFTRYKAVYCRLSNIDLEDYLGSLNFKFEGKEQKYNFTKEQFKIFERCKAILEKDDIKIEYDRKEERGFWSSTYYIQGIKFVKILGKA